MPHRTISESSTLLSNTLLQCESGYTVSSFVAPLGRASMLKRLIWRDFVGLVVLTQWLAELAAEYRPIAVEWREWFRQLPGTPTTLSGPALEPIDKLLLRRQRLLDRAEVLVESLYEKLYNLKEIIKAEPNIENLVDVRLFGELIGHCNFRNKQVVHKCKASALVGGGRMIPEDVKDYQLWRTPFAPSKAATNDLDTLWAECMNELAPSDAAFIGNFHLRCEKLTSLVGRSTPKLREKIAEFTGKHGAVSVTVAELCSFSAELGADVLPKLQKLEDGPPIAAA